MPAASMPWDNPLFNWLRSIQWVLSSERPLKVSGPFGDFDVEYHIDPNFTEPDNTYALIGFMMPDDDNILVEIDEHGGTVGNMTGIRIYLDPVE